MKIVPDLGEGPSNEKYVFLMSFYVFLILKSKAQSLFNFLYLLPEREREKSLTSSHFNNDERKKYFFLKFKFLNLLVKDCLREIKLEKSKLRGFFLSLMKKKSYQRSEIEKATPLDIKVSVIMPVYNSSDTLIEAIQSVLTQSLSQIELICVDDGSEDNSCEIINNCFNDNRLRLIKISHAGASSARNCGIRCSRGKYLYFIDSDDVLERNALEKCFVLAEKNKLDFISFNAYTFYDSPFLKEKFPYFEMAYQRELPTKNIYRGEDLFNFQMQEKAYRCVPWLVFPSRKLILDNNIEFKEGITYEDNLFVLELYLKANRCMHLNEVLYNRRIRRDSCMTKAITPFNLYSYFKVFLGILDLSHISTSIETDKNIGILTVQIAQIIDAQYNTLKNQDLSLYLSSADIFVIKNLMHQKVS